MQAHYDLFVGIDVAATTFTATWCTATINAVPYSAKNLSAERS